MKKLLFIILTVLVPEFLFAQDLQYARDIVSQLTNPKFSGRGYINKGDKLVAEFISNEMKKFNIKNELQHFNISANTFPGKLSVKINNETLKPAVDYLLEPSSTSLKGEFEIIKTSRSEINTKEKFIALLRKSNNVFVYVDNTKNPEESAEIKELVDDYIKYLKYSKDFGAKGIIVYSPDKLTWWSASYETHRPVIILNKNQNIGKSNTIDVNIESKFLKTYETQNVIGQIKGTSNSDSIVIFSAHYDHLGMLGSNTIYPGANDNASGVAMLLSLAKYYSENPPLYNTVFISFSANELGLLGSRAFLENPTIDLSKVKFLVNFDIVGTGEEGINTVNGLLYPTQFELMKSINDANKWLPKVDVRGEACNSDHCFFKEKNIPSFFIYTQGGIKAYHDLDDKAETLPLTKFNELFKLMVEFARQL